MDLLNSPPFFHFCGIILLTSLLFLGRKAGRRGIFIRSLWNFVGVFLHETCHLVVGIALLGSPAGFTLIPKLNEKGRWVMGAVRFKKLNALNSLPIGLAPLSLLGFSGFLYRNWERWFSLTLKSTLSLYLIIFFLLYNCLPSSQDLKVALNWKSVLLYISIGLLILFMSHYSTLHSILSAPSL